MENKQINNKKNIQGYVAVGCMCISAVLAVIIFISELKDGGELLNSLLSAPIAGCILGGVLSGVTHIPEMHNKLKWLLLIPFVGWMLWLIIVIAFPWLGGCLFMIIDFIRFMLERRVGKNNENR